MPVDSGAASATDPPVEIVLVVDAVNASFQAVNYDRIEIKKFLLQNGGKLVQPVSLVIFSEAGTKIQDGLLSRWKCPGGAIRPIYTTGLRSRNRDQWERFNMSDHGHDLTCGVRRSATWPEGDDLAQSWLAIAEGIRRLKTSLERPASPFQFNRGGFHRT